MDMKITVTTPKPPNFIEVQMPGKTKKTRLPLSEFTGEQLAQIGDDMKRALIKGAAEQRDDRSKAASKAKTPPK